MRIELRTAPGCPNTEPARTVVAHCLETVGIDIPIIELVGQYPSRTVLIDGVDVMRSHCCEPSATDVCRLDTPTHERVLDVLRASLVKHR